MIAKIKTGHFFKGAFQYNIKKIEERKASFFYSSSFKLEEPTFKDMIHEFNEMVEQCPNVSKPVFHTSINFPPDEELDDDTLKSVVDEYMDRLGYRNTPYVVFKHNDTNHQHVHIISANIENKNGKYKKIKDSYIYLRSEAISRGIEKRYGLINVDDRAKRENLRVNIIPELKEYGEVSTYQHLHDVTSYILNNYVFSNLLELNKLLTNYNIACYRNKTKQGDVFYKFTFQNIQKGKGIGIGGSLKQLKINSTPAELEKLFESNRQKKDTMNYSIQDISKQLMDKYMFMSQSDFDKFFLSKGIIKIDDNAYLHKNNKSVLSLYDLRIPKKFLNDATLNKEYFTNIVKSATEYRKTVGVFHESTMFKNRELIAGFKNFFYKQDSHLTGKQKELLYNSFCAYKIKALDKINQKEYDKDLKFVNKMLDYTAKIHISESTAWKFLENYDIFINGSNTIRIGNSMDNVIHDIYKKDTLSLKLNFGGRDCTDDLSKLSADDYKLISAAINDKPCVLTEQMEWERVKTFLPDDYILKYDIENRLSHDECPVVEDNTIQDQSYSPHFFNSQNEYEYRPKKKKKYDDDDEIKPKKRK